jgi:cyanophycinase
MNFQLKASAAAMVFAGLAACGGGTTAPPAPPAPAAPQSGKLVDPVAGLEFETSSGLKGSTDAQGTFSFRPGDTVKFKAGKLQIGEGRAAAVMTMENLVAAAQSAGDAKVLNLIQVLQTLDEDSNPANGIAISPATLAKLAALPADVQAKNLNDSDLQTQVVDAVFGAGVRALASEAQALNAAMAVQSKVMIAAMPVVTNYVIGGGIRSCSSFNGDRKSSNCAADWTTMLAQDPAFAGLSKANISFDSNYVLPSFTYTINQANIDKIAALPTANPEVMRATQKTALLSALNARLADPTKPSTNLSFGDLDGGKPVFADGPAFWNNSDGADFDLMVVTLCGTDAPVNGTLCTLSDANIAKLEAATFAVPDDRAKLAMLLRKLRIQIGTQTLLYRRDAGGATGTPNLRSSFLDPAFRFAADGTAPVLGLSDGLNNQELAALRESFVNPNPQTARKIEARSVAFLSNVDSKDIYDSFVASARSLNAGATPTIGVFTSATENPWYDHDINVTALKSAGAKVAYIPMDGGTRKALDENNNCLYASLYYANYGNSNSASVNFHMDQVYPDIAAERTRLCANNAAALNSTLAGLNGVFLGGGDQARHLETFIGKDAGGAYTVLSPQLLALKTRFDAGQLVVAGTSAGAAVQAGGVWKGIKVPMLGAGRSWEVLNAGYAPGAGPTAAESLTGALYAEGGLGFFRYGVLDQHFSQRTREGRMIRATKESGLDYGFGVDENTTLVVAKPDASGKTTMTVLGAGGVFIADVRAAAATVVGTTQYSISGVKTHYISAGDKVEIDSAGELSVLLGNAKPVVAVNASTLVATATQVQEYGSSNYLKLAQKMGSTGAAKAYGSTEGSAGQSPYFSVTLSRSANTVFRVAGERLSYTNVLAAIAPCAGNVCTAPAN